MKFLTLLLQSTRSLTFTDLSLFSLSFLFSKFPNFIGFKHIVITIKQIRRKYLCYKLQLLFVFLSVYQGTKFFALIIMKIYWGLSLDYLFKDLVNHIMAPN